MTTRERRAQALASIARHRGEATHSALVELLGALLDEAHEQLVSGEDMRTLFQAQGSANTVSDILTAITRESA